MVDRFYTVTDSVTLFLGVFLVKVKEFLKKIVTIDNMIDAKVNQVAQLRSLLDVCSVRYDGDKIQVSGGDDKFADTVAKIIDLEDEINADIDSLIAHKELARQMIESLDDDTQKLILYKRYFEKKTFEQIAVELNYCWRQIHRLHGNALVKMDKAMECHRENVI